METYRRDRSYLWNYRHGPSFDGPWPIVPPTPMVEAFGLRVASRFGVAAGLLLNSRWIECYARLGWDVLTYKTVRSAARSCYPLPNWVWVEAPGGGLDPGADEVLRVGRRARDPARATSAVCFGMPSMEPEVWRGDVTRARRALRAGQILVVSVVGTPTSGGGESALIEDFVCCARWAAAAGAHVVEANFSCPNVCTPEGSVYQDAAASARLSRALRDALPSTPLFIKAGHFASAAAQLEFQRAVEGSADAVVLVNGLARRVLRADGRPAFGVHERVGVLGDAIRPAALYSVRRFVAARTHGAEAIAVGGITEEAAISQFLEAGARLALAGGAPMFDPLLASRWKARTNDL